MLIVVEDASSLATHFGSTKKSSCTHEAKKEGSFGVKKVFFLSLNHLIESHGSLVGLGDNFFFFPLSNV